MTAATHRSTIRSACSSTLSNLVSGVAAILGQAFSSDNSSPLQSAIVGRTHGYTEVTGQQSSFSIKESPTSLVRIFAIIDPVTEQAQKWSSLIQVSANNASSAWGPSTDTDRSLADGHRTGPCLRDYSDEPSSCVD